MTSVYKDTAIIVHGPRGCGKSRNAHLFAGMFGKVKVVEADDAKDPNIKFGKNGTMHCTPLDADTLYLTCTPWVAINAPTALIMPFDTALSMLRNKIDEEG